MNKRLFLICAVAWPTLAPAMSNPNFTPCTLTGTTPGVSVEAECSRWVVPENREQPDGRTIELLFARVPAVSKSPRPDPVVLLAGGPGQSATETYPQLAGAFARLNRTRDIWLIDQRGTGGSNPLDCPYPKETMFATPDPALISGIARDCRERLEREGNDLARYTTTDYIADLEQLREAMGVAELNLYGGSYGTRVGLEYLRRHPSAIRSAVLDGVVPPDLGLGQDHASNLDATLAQAFEQCRTAPDCAERFDAPGRTLSRLREQLRASPQQLTIRHPRTAAPEAARLDHDLLAVVVRLYAYAPETVALLPLLLDEALAGRGEALVAQALLVAESLSDAIHMGLSMAVSCSEDAHRVRNDPQDAQRLMGQSMTQALIQQCADWPTRPSPTGFEQPLVSEVPVLLLSGEWDPVTPPRYGERVLEGLVNGRHLVAPGQGHIVLPRGCISRLAAEFVDGLAPAELDDSCLASLGPPPFFIDHNGPTP